MREETTRVFPGGADGPGRDLLNDSDEARALPTVSLLALQFLAWVAARSRTRGDVMEAWRSTCPRQSVWEDMMIDGLVRIEDGTAAVVLTPLGRAVLAHAETSEAARS